MRDDKRKVILVLLVCALVALGLWRVLVVERAPPVYRVYLPVVMRGPGPALKGVGHSGPCAAVEKLGVDWYYSWGSTLCEAGDKRFVTMIYGRIHPEAIPDQVAMARATSGWLLGFNEPNLGNQANMTVEEAAVLWHQIEQQAVNIKLVSPAPSQHDPGWLWRMVDEYRRRYGTKPRFDAIAAHIYTGDPQVAKRYLVARRNEALGYGYNVPIWVTEWAGLCTLPDPRNGNHRMMREMIPWMRRQEWIARYAWFASRIKGDELWGSGWQHCSLTEWETGELSKLGELYRGL